MLRWVLARAVLLGDVFGGTECQCGTGEWVHGGETLPHIREYVDNNLANKENDGFRGKLN